MPTSHPDGLAPVSDDRRRFLRFLGAGTLAVGAAGTLAACDSNDPNFDTPTPPAPPTPGPGPGPGPEPEPEPAAVRFDFASPVGVLNYAYALEQLEAAYYSMVAGMDGFDTLFPENEQRLIRDLAAHEAIHRDFLAAAITMAAGEDALIPNLSLNEAEFAGLTTREAILDTALVFEDLGVAAYNGAGQYLPDDDQNNAYLTIAGKIVSVEARHAAAIARTRFPGEAARLGGGVIDEMGLDRAFAPSDVLAAAQRFVLNTLDADNE